MAETKRRSQADTMEGPPDNRPSKKVNSIFATSPDGRVYEIPAKDAEKYVLSKTRVKELGHLPLLPYTVLESKSSTSNGATLAESEVGGRHMAYNPYGRLVWHSNWLYGTYIWHADLGIYTGWHYHPWGTALAYDVDDHG